MKLSEAIREGAKLRPQAFGGYFEWDDEDSDDPRNANASCALGAAIEAIKGEPFTDFLSVDEVLQPATGVSTYTTTVVYRGQESDLFMAISNMNDQEGMSREAIADWLEAQGY